MYSLPSSKHYKFPTKFDSHPTILPELESLEYLEEIKG